MESRPSTSATVASLEGASQRRTICIGHETRVGGGTTDQREIRHHDVMQTGRHPLMGWRGNNYLSNGEAICCCPDEGSKKSIRKPVYEMWYFGIVTP